MPTTPTEVDHLEYVREKLRVMPVSDRPRLAVDADISLSTLYNVIKGKRDVKYNNVMKLYKTLKIAEAVGARKP